MDHPVSTGVYPDMRAIGLFQRRRSFDVASVVMRPGRRRQTLAVGFVGPTGLRVPGVGDVVRAV